MYNIEQRIDYKTALINVLKVDEKDAKQIDNYITALSWFLCDSDIAYQYNRMYLIQQNEQFRQFILKANKKKLRLEQVIEKIKDLYKKDSKLWLEPSEVYITLNGFWKANLMGSTSLCEEPSFCGVLREDRTDMLTIRYRDKSVSCYLNDEVSHIMETISKMIE